MLVNRLIIQIVSLLAIALPARAGLIIQADFISLTDATSVASTTGTDSSSSFYNVDLMFTVDSKRTVALGWAVISPTTSTKVASTTADYTSSDMGPVVKWMFGQDQMYSLTAAYGIVCSGSYKITGSTAETWAGTSTFVQYSVQPKISDYFRIAFSLNYYSASYSTKVVNKTETSVGYSKTLMFPMIGLTYQW